MAWFLPTVVASSVLALVVSVVYFYLYKQEKQKYLAIWAGCWLFFSIRFVIHCLIVQGVVSESMVIVQQITTLVSGYLFIWGTYLLLEKQFSVVWLLSAVLCFVWTIIAYILNVSFFLFHMPTAFYLGVVFAITGYSILRTDDLHGFGKYISGWGLILWGIHKADYAILRPVEWFTPWGYLIAGLLFVSTAIGILLIYFEKVKSDLINNKKELIRYRNHLEDLVLERTFELSRVNRELKESEERYKNIFNKITDSIFIADADSKILEANPAACRTYGYSLEEMKKMHALDLITPEYHYMFEEFNRGIKETGFFEGDTIDIRKDGTAIYTEVKGSVITHKGKECLVALIRDITRRKEMEHEREILIKKLEKLLAEIKTLRGILPICSFCKKIRDDKGFWEQVDVYLDKYSEAAISHGICPDCMKTHYPKEFVQIETRKKRTEGDRETGSKQPSTNPPGR